MVFLIKHPANSPSHQGQSSPIQYEENADKLQKTQNNPLNGWGDKNAPDYNLIKFKQIL